MIPKALAVALAGTLCGACANDFEKQSQVTRLRVLAVQAEPAELLVVEGGIPPRTVLTALAVEPNGAAVSTAFALCLVQVSTPSPDLDCPGDAGVQLPDAGPSQALLDLGDPALRPAAQGVAAGGTSGGSAAFPVLVGFTATAKAGFLPDGGPPGDASGRQRIDGFSIVPLRSGDPARPLNHNPSLSALRANGVDVPGDGSFTLRPSARVTLLPVPAPDAREPTPEGPEHLGFSFFATRGELSALRAADTTSTGEPALSSVDYSAPAELGPVRLWIVVRDGRGGVGWLVRDLSIVP